MMTKPCKKNNKTIEIDKQTVCEPGVGGGGGGGILAKAAATSSAARRNPNTPVVPARWKTKEGGTQKQQTIFRTDTTQPKKKNLII